MTKLKHLKDLIDEDLSNECNIEVIEFTLLKAEAVKCAKANCRGEGIANVYGWIKWFFNLTEEDLLGEKDDN